jgi:hypothetical protein
MAHTIKVSSQPKALTILSRTKHRRQTAIKEIPRKVVVTIKIDLLRPCKGNILTAQENVSAIHHLYPCTQQSPRINQGEKKRRAINRENKIHPDQAFQVVARTAKRGGYSGDCSPCFHVKKKEKPCGANPRKWVTCLQG